MRARTASVALVVALGGLLAGCGDGAEDGDESRDRASGSAGATSGTEPPSDEPTSEQTTPREVAQTMREALSGPVTAQVDVSSSRGGESFVATGSAGFAGATPVLQLQVDFVSSGADGTYLVENDRFSVQGPGDIDLPTEGPVGPVVPWGIVLATADPVALSFMVEAFGRSVEVSDGPDDAVTYDVGVRPRRVLELIGYDVDEIDPVSLPREYFVTVAVADDGRLLEVRSDFDRYAYGITEFSRWRQLAGG